VGTDFSPKFVKVCVTDSESEFNSVGGLNLNRTHGNMHPDTIRSTCMLLYAEQRDGSPPTRQ